MYNITKDQLSNYCDFVYYLITCSNSVVVGAVLYRQMDLENLRATAIWEFLEGRYLPN